jgi:hypothetical protein
MARGPCLAKSSEAEGTKKLQVVKDIMTCNILVEDVMNISKSDL